MKFLDALKGWYVDGVPIFDTKLSVKNADNKPSNFCNKDKVCINAWSFVDGYYQSIKFVSEKSRLHFKGEHTYSPFNKPVVGLSIFVAKKVGENAYKIIVSISNSLGKYIQFGTNYDYISKDICNQIAYKIMHFVNQFKVIDPHQIMVFCDTIMECDDFEY